MNIRPQLPPTLPDPGRIRVYAKAHGWEKERDFRGLSLFGRSDDDLAQIAVPLDGKADGYRRAVQDVLVTLAEFRQITPQRVLAEIATVQADVLRFTLADASTRGGGVPLGRAERMMAGIKTSLLAAAHSVVAPAGHHARMSRTDPVALVDRCRLARTSRGSFRASVTCPLDAVRGEEGLMPGGESFARRTTVLLMRALGSLRSAMDEDDPFRVVQKPGLISSNLCAALSDMRPETGGRVAVESFWAGAVDPPEDVPGTVRFDEREFSVVERVRESLRPQREPEGREFVGFVRELKGEPDENGRVCGEVKFEVVRDQGLEGAIGELTPDDYRRATAAHLAERPVLFRATFEPHARTSRLLNLVWLGEVRPGGGGVREPVQRDVDWKKDCF